MTLNAVMTPLATPDAAVVGHSTLCRPRVPGLVARVKRALEGLKEQADVSAQDPLIGDGPPASARETRAFVKDIEIRLAKL